MQEIIRNLEIPVELVTVERDGKQRKVLRGTAAVYYDGQRGSEYQLTENMVERIAPGAFDEVLRDNPDVRCSVNHETKETVARTPRTLRVWSDSKGLQYEAELPNTRSATDTWENVASGIIRGSSFRATADYRNDATFSKENGKDVVTIKRFRTLVDVAPCVAPAYLATDCQAIARCRDEALAEHETQIRLERAKIMLSQHT